MQNILFYRIIEIYIVVFVMKWNTYQTYYSSTITWHDSSCVPTLLDENRKTYDPNQKIQ